MKKYVKIGNKIVIITVRETTTRLQKVKQSKKVYDRNKNKKEVE